MGICSSAMNRQDLGKSSCELTENDMTTFKTSGNDEYGQSLVISSKQLNIEDDPTKQFLHLYFEQHKKEIDQKIVNFYMGVLKNDSQPLTDISLKMHDLCKKQAKFLSCLISYCPQLTKLNLWETLLGDIGLRYLTKALPKLKSLEQLSIEQNSITQDGFLYFSKGLRHLTALKALSISNNVIGCEGMKSLCVALENCSGLEEIYMHNDEIDTQTLEIFSTVVRCLKNLGKLGLGYNKLDTSSLNTIRFILSCGKIEEMYLKGNNISDDDADCLAAEFIGIAIEI